MGKWLLIVLVFVAMESKAQRIAEKEFSFRSGDNILHGIVKLPKGKTTPLSL